MSTDLHLGSGCESERVTDHLKFLMDFAQLYQPNKDGIVNPALDRRRSNPTPLYTLVNYITYINSQQRMHGKKKYKWTMFILTSRPLSKFIYICLLSVGYY